MDNSQNLYIENRSYRIKVEGSQRENFIINISFSLYIVIKYLHIGNCSLGWNASKLYHGFPKPSARLISTKIMSAHTIEADSRYTSFLMQWGQFLDHDITLTPMSVSRARLDVSSAISYTQP